MSEELDELTLDDDGLSASLPLVERIVVRGLHGRANYDLNLKATDQNDRLTLFYGDNGSGKTTILRVLWDLLSPAPRKNHRTRIAKVAFEEFTVFLTGGVRLRAHRKLPVAGPFEIEARRNSRLISRSQWPDRHTFEDFFEDWTIADYAKRLESLEPEVAIAGRLALGKRKYLELIQKFGNAPYYLADDRSTSSDEVDAERIPVDMRRLRGTRDGQSAGQLLQNTLADELERSLSQVNSKLRRLALGGTVSGSAGANSVYMEVVRHLTVSSLLEMDATVTRTALLDRVREMGARSRGYETLGLVPRFSSQQFCARIEQVPEENLAVLRSILNPYLESFSARLDAMEGPRSLIQTLLDEANRYLSDKKVIYRARILRIVLADGTVLRADQLSSGECHVLLLLFNAVLARGNARVFLIDEPELSLNVKWQRQIVRSLLSLTEGSGLQFLLATHSIELLSSYRTRVVQLHPEINA